MDDINKKIHELLGKLHTCDRIIDEHGTVCGEHHGEIPEYATDLNEAAEAENFVIKKTNLSYYHLKLKIVVGNDELENYDPLMTVVATAEQRCRAILLTAGWGINDLSAAE